MQQQQVVKGRASDSALANGCTGIERHAKSGRRVGRSLKFVPVPEQTAQASRILLAIMRVFLRTLCLAILVNIVIGVVGPAFESGLYAMRIAALPVPSAFDMPVASVRSGALRDTWHAAREGGRRRHEGIDIFARRGTPVRAATEGIVTRVGSSRLGGKIVWVMAPGGQRHYYAHLDRFAWIHAGMRVQAGTVLGYVGNSGNAAGTPPHLHYGIYTATGAVNPYPFLRNGM